MVPRAQFAHLGLVAVGLLLVVSGLFVVGGTDYSHEVHEVAASAVPEDATVREFASLSEPARRVLTRALEASDATARTATRLAAFAYGDAGGPTYVRSEGSTLVVRTAGSDVLTDADDFLGTAMAGFGAIAVLVGSFDWYRHRR